MHRRKFLQRASHLLAGLSHWRALTPLTPQLPAHLNTSARAIDPRDEKFWSLVREQFPLTKERAYLNTGGLGASPYAVIAAVQNKMNELERVSETGHSEELWRGIKEKAGQILGCKAEEIAFTRNATEGCAIVCNGLPFERGDEVITTTHEHVGNTISWLAKQKREGIVIKTFAPATKSAQVNVERIARLLTQRTRALSLPHITASTGQVMPVKQIGELAAAHKLWYFVDGAQAPGMMPVNVREIGCHAYATSGHKWLLGPKGTGLLYVREDALDLIAAKHLGAYSNTGEFDLTTGALQLHPSAQRYEYGTMSTPLFAGLGAAMDFLLGLGMQNVWQRNCALAAALRAGLYQLGVEINSPEEHSAMITFALKNRTRDEITKFLAERFKLRTRGVYEGGLNAVRVSLHVYNSFAEVERVLEGVKEMGY